MAATWRRLILHTTIREQLYSPKGDNYKSIFHMSVSLLELQFYIYRCTKVKRKWSSDSYNINQNLLLCSENFYAQKS
jgi:hypothetical protein